MYKSPGCLNLFQTISCIAPRASLPLVHMHGIAPVSVKERRMTSSFTNTWKHTVSLTQNEDIQTLCTPHGTHCRYGSWIQVIVKTHTVNKTGFQHNKWCSCSDVMRFSDCYKWRGCEAFWYTRQCNRPCLTTCSKNYLYWKRWNT